MRGWQRKSEEMKLQNFVIMAKNQKLQITVKFVELFLVVSFILANIQLLRTPWPAKPVGNSLYS